MSLDDFALTQPTRAIAILSDGTVARADGTAAPTAPAVAAELRIDELVERSRRLARQFAAAGLREGDAIALLLENRLEYFELTWAAQRMGMHYVPVNWHLQRDEVAHILCDSEARWLFV